MFPCNYIKIGKYWWKKWTCMFCKSNARIMTSICPQLFKTWITLYPLDKISIQWIIQLPSQIRTPWMVFFPVDTIIQHLNNWCPRLILFKYLVVYGGGAVSPILLSSSPLKLPQPVCQSVWNPCMSLTERKSFSKFWLALRSWTPVCQEVKTRYVTATGERS